MKIFEFFEKHKNLVFATVAILVLAFAALCFYRYEVSDDNQAVIKSHTLGGITSVDDTIELSQGQTMVQKYESANLNYGQLGFAANPTTDNAVLEITISDGKNTQTKTIEKGQFTAGYTYVDLDKAFKNADDAELQLTFVAKEGDFLFSANKSIDVEGGSCTVQSEERQTNAVIDLRTIKTAKGDLKYIILAAITIVFIIALMLVIKFKIFDIAALTAIVLAFFTIICLALFPPFTVPDEGSHYRSVYHISNMIMFDFSDEEKALRMRECDYEYLISSNNSMLNQDYVSEKGFDKLVGENTKVITTDRQFMTNKLAPHFAGGFGLSVARILGLGPYWAFTLARAFNALQCILLIYFAIKIIPFGKIAMAAISLIPINLHIMSSCSYDAFTFGGVVLMFAYIMKMMYADEKIGWKKLLILAAMIILVIPQKVVYIGVAAILLLIPKEKFEKPKLHLVFKCALGAIAVLSILFLQISNASKVVSDTVTNSATQGFSIGYILSNPGKMIMMLYETIVQQGDFYVKSLISFFGWFEFQPPWFMAIPFVVILCLAFMRRCDEPAALGVVPRMYSLALFGVVFLAVELLLLLDHTYMGSEIILGVQGRYFIPALPLLFIFLRNNTIELKKNADMKLLFTTALLNCGMFIYSCSKIV